jgi:trehalose 6-phosphate phosphatase
MTYPDDLPDALEAAHDVRELLGDDPAFFLDYDGSLTAIVSRPEDATITDEVRDLLAGLAERFTVAIVSGRGAVDVGERVGLGNVIYAGSHGYEIDFPDGRRFEHPEAFEAVRELNLVEAEVSTDIGRLVGVTVERKPFAIAVHTRNASGPSDRDLAAASVRRSVEGREHLVVRRGKEVLEVRPAIDWDKGTTVRHLLDAEAPGSVPIFIGDDETDEDGFRVVNHLGGVSIFVGDGRDTKTAARFRLDDPSAVVRFLSLF